MAKANNLFIAQTPAVNDGAIKTLLSGSATDSAGRCAATVACYCQIAQEYCSKPLSGETLVVIIQSDITEPRSGETGLSV
ncbi:MAG: hypothetical protein P4L45_11360 [Ignavibacteriaceae bacterium]|nr:hypothetical protein [Ignavibacteriaceae bacterium]